MGFPMPGKQNSSEVFAAEIAEDQEKEVQSSQTHLNKWMLMTPEKKVLSD